MAYRSDDEAETERLRGLSAQMAELELRLAQRNTLRAHRERTLAQLKDATSAAAKRRAKVPLPLLSRIRVASPCHAPWDQMSGDERVRHCAACDKDVYDLSEMTTAEAEDLLQNVGESACVRLHRRTDGTVITSDCPVGAKRKRRNRWLAAGAGMAGGAMAGAAALLNIGADGPAKPACTIQPYDGRAVGGVAVMMPEPEVEALPDYSMTTPRAGGIRMMPDPHVTEDEGEDAHRETEPRRRRRSHAR